MAESLTDMLSDLQSDLCDHIARAPKEDLGGFLLDLAGAVYRIAAKLEGEQPAPDDQQDDVSRVLEMADARINELRSKRLATAKEESYGLAHDYTCMADVLNEFSFAIRKEFNRE